MPNRANPLPRLPLLCSLFLLACGGSSGGGAGGGGGGGVGGKAGSAGGGSGHGGSAGGGAGAGGSAAAGAGGSSAAGAGGSSATGAGGSSTAGAAGSSAGAGGSSAAGAAGSSAAGAGGSSRAGAGGSSAAGAGGASGGAGGAGGTKSDGGIAGTSGSDAGGPAFCGSAPLDPLNFNFDSTNSFRGDFSFTSSGCVGKVIPKTPGRQTINFTDGAVVWIRGDVTTGYLPFYLAELKPIAGFTDDIGTLIWDTTSIAAIQALVPSYNPSTMALITVGTYLSKTGTAAPCNVNSGVTYTVTNHPEAVVLYGDWKHGQIAAGTATETSGGAYITLTPTSALEFVSVVGTKAGCTVTNTGYVYTGRTPIAPGTTSTALGF